MTLVGIGKEQRVPRTRERSVPAIGNHFTARNSEPFEREILFPRMRLPHDDLVILPGIIERRRSRRRGLNRSRSEGRCGCRIVREQRKRTGEERGYPTNLFGRYRQIFMSSSIDFKSVAPTIP